MITPSIIRGTADKWYVTTDNGPVAFNTGLYNIRPDKGLITADATVVMLIKSLVQANDNTALTDQEVLDEMNRVNGEILTLYPNFLDFPLMPGTPIDESDFIGATVEEDTGLTKQEEQELRDRCGTGFYNFLQGFHMDLSKRLINTMGQMVEKSKTAAKTYLYNYFNLIDNGYEQAVKSQMNGQEFENWLDDLKKIPKSAPINKRLKIFYGPAGAGKTYDATHSKGYVGCIVCAEDKYPSDLFKEYDPNNGAPVWRATCLKNAVINGGVVVLDEINLLPIGTIQFLQGLLDNKDEIDLFGEHVQIHPDFSIIGTMNLIIGGAKRPLTEAFVDRCFEIKEYKNTGKEAGAAI